jgi:hypothetical protein
MLLPFKLFMRLVVVFIYSLIGLNKNYMKHSNTWLCFFSLLVVFFMIQACAYNKGDTPVPTNPNVSYTMDIKPILIANCYICHTDTSTNPDRNTSVFFNHFNQLQHEATTPSTANSNYTILIARLKHIETPGMPYNRAPLADSLIAKIQDWVLIGAPEN